jgi:surfactin synthase thioesterase subunit
MTAWLPGGEPPTSDTRVFCFPHAGGGAVSFAEWPSHADVTLCPVQPPGRAERFREPPHSRVESYVDALLAGLGHQFTGRYAFFGHSVGALVAYRLTRRLHALGATPPAHLFVSGRAAPHLPYTRTPLHDLPTAELVGHLRRMGGTPDVILDDPGLLDVFLPVLRADFSVNETYRHEPGLPLPVPVTVFGGAEDPRADTEELHAWGALTSCREFAVHTYPGGHFYLERHAPSVLEVIASGTRQDGDPAARQARSTGDGRQFARSATHRKDKDS